MRVEWFGLLALAFASIGVTASSADAASPEAEAYLEQALKLLRERHINSSEADWPKIEEAARAQIVDAEAPADTYPAIRAVLQALREKHSFLVEPRHSVPAGGHDPQGRSAGAQPLMPTWQIVDGKVGVVRLPALDTLGSGRESVGTAYAAAVRSGLQQMDSDASCGWIVDLRENGGGNMWPMLRGLDPLLGEAPFGHFVVPGDKTMPWIRTPGGISPLMVSLAATEPVFALDHAQAPVAVLLGPKTASSGEMAAIALIGRSGVRTFGEATAGLTTANEPHPLSDGAYLLITVTTVRDRTGTDYAGPIVPDEQVPLAAAEEKAIAWLRGECSAAP